MSNQQLIIIGILMLALVMFAWGKLRYDIVAMGALLLGVISGVVPMSQAFMGFGHTAVITVACVLIISFALQHSGLVDVIATKLAKYTSNIYIHIASLTTMVTVASAFMNNVGALALMLPVAMATAHEHKRSPAILLMPLAFGSILGGMTTLIGTPPNIIVSAFRQEMGLGGFALFDFAKVGVALSAIGLIYITFIGWRLLPMARRKSKTAQQFYEINEYLTEIGIPDNSKLIGQRLGSVDFLNSDSIEVIGVARGSGRATQAYKHHILSAGDVLILRSDPNEIHHIIEENGLELVTTADQAYEHLAQTELSMIEAVVMPDSVLSDKSISYFKRRTGNAIALVALSRRGHAVIKRLRRQTFQSGDILLLRGDPEIVETSLSSLGLLPLANRNIRLGIQRKVGKALLIFGVAIGLGVSGVLELPIAFLLAIGGFLLAKIITPQQIYEDVDWPIIVLIAAMIPIGQALESTGTTALIAENIVSATQGFPIWAILAILLIITMCLTDIINNSATALVMAPIALGIARTLEVNPDTFLMAAAIGASSAFLTPIGHQSNTLVMGPGGYEFSDYWRMGLILDILIVIVAVPLLLIMWPL